MTRVILLDVDGVLVQPGGYRAALRATVEHFIGDFTIEEDLLTGFEKRGISSEWDMVPLIIASYWTSILIQQPMQDLPDDVSAAAQVIHRRRRVDGSIKVPDFENVNGKYPAQTAYEAGLFSPIHESLRKNLLTETRDVHKSHSMRTFQHFTLGSKHFAETYNLQAEFETESLLLKYDHSNIDEKIRVELLRDGNHLVAFTARPSAPPREVDDSHLGYAPEAELALELVGLADIPLMAFGKLEYLAAQRGMDAGTLVKPAPVHALAAIAAALTGDEWAGLQSAGSWLQMKRITGVLADLPRSFELVVVEDTLGGIRSTQAAGEILRDAGFDVTVHAFGLTSGSKAKADAFEQAGIVHFENWDELIPTLRQSLINS
ncbi:MAG TPA: hypothetical protein VJ972_06380 [Anaerolineales bacterium]|nr:hypothetical protein [Anaerolineales bacterium]